MPTVTADSKNGRLTQEVPCPCGEAGKGPSSFCLRFLGKRKKGRQATNMTKG